MPYIPPEVVQEVKRMDLLTYLKNYEPYELVHFSGNTYTTRTHDSLKISNGKWMWWSRGIGGRSALDYLIKVKDYSFFGGRLNCLQDRQIFNRLFLYLSSFQWKNICCYQKKIGITQMCSVILPDGELTMILFDSV